MILGGDSFFIRPVEAARCGDLRGRRSFRTRILSLLIATTSLLLSACSVRTLAANRVGDMLAAGGTTYSADDDPDLVGEALPFSLKLMEGVLAETPNHRNLLAATSSGFTQYAYGWVQLPAEEIGDDDPEEAERLRERAKRLYLRAQRYGLRGLDVAHPGLSPRLITDAREVLKVTTRDDVPLLYWTAASWGLAIGLAKDDPEMVADLNVVEALIDRALELDESWDGGSIHSFLITYEPARIGASGDPEERCRRHFDRAIALSDGNLASPYVALAEAVTIRKQDHAAFEQLLTSALAVDVDRRPEWRVSNLLAQRRARWLLDHADNYFILDAEQESEASEDPSSDS
jgi:predicted anti-sigma-YlaC factor YlaD